MSSVAILASTKDMDRDKWLELRKRGIGGSDAAAIAGLSRWRSPMAVYLEKTGEVEPDEPGEAAYWGTVLEDIVAKEFTKRTGLKIQRRNAILMHPKHHFMLANLDRVIIDPDRGKGILEVKTTSSYKQDEWADDRVPDEYMLQVQHYLAVTGLDYAYIAVLIGGQKYQHQLIPRDDELIDYLIKIESDFWQLVESKTPPEMDGSEASVDLLNTLYPVAQRSEIILPPTAGALIKEYDAAKVDEKAAAQRKETAANKLKDMLQSNEIGYCGDRKVTWKNVTSTRVDSKLLKEKNPRIYRKYSKETTTRRFDVN